mgnify:CR=1 FL=1
MAKKQPKLKAEKRDLKGRKVNKLRKEDILPANIYGKGIDSQAVKLSQIDFEQTYDKIGETSVLSLDIKGEDKERPVLISQVQFHPVSGNPIHVDFRQIDLKEKVIATVPVVLKGEAPAEEKGAVIVKLIDQLDVQALPTDLPDKLELNISSLEDIGDSLSTEDFDIDREKIDLQIDQEMEAVQAQEPREEEEIAPPPAEEELEEGEVPEGEEGETPEGEEEQETEAPEGEEAEEKPEEK